VAAPLALAGLTAAGLALAPRPAAAQTQGEAACTALAQPGRFAGATVASARAVAPNPAAKLPAFCEVTATLSPVPGSRIGVVFRLPAQWNGKLIGYGGGGWAGNVRLETAAADLARGYATLQTDGGHPNPNAGDATWVAPGGKVDEVALNDFAWRAVHTMTDVGKQMVVAYYGRPQAKAYFEGCSTGGRMALMEAQRFPDDYDAIIAGAPVYSTRVQLGEIYRDWIFAQPGAAVTPAQVKLVHDAALATCDAADGVKDGIITDPRACRFDPAVLQCKTGQSADETCLTPAQATAFRREYETVRGPDGTPYVFGYSVGSEYGWPAALNLTADPQKAAQARDLQLRAALFDDPNFDFARFDVMRDSPRARATAFAKYYEADNPDLRRFLQKGGKLILWHGLDDQLPSPWGTLDYYQRVQTASGAAAQSGVRLFLAPGVLHCGGGPGANSFDMVAALDNWVEHGTAPERIVGVRVTRPIPGGPPNAPTPAGPPLSRPVCAYPAFPHYTGEGDSNEAANFVCR
jgi:feruloyl esterase